jgi:2-oxo-3-hexenedioate decarboxylase
MAVIDAKHVAEELLAAHADRRTNEVPPTARFQAFDLSLGYAVEAEFVRLKLAAGHRAVGRKVGYANKAVWRALKLETLAWAHMYDDTVRFAEANAAALALDRLVSPKIEPEIVFKLRAPIPDPAADAAAVLGAVEWFALGFEIIDCVYENWTFQPADFVASFGLHAALVVGERRPVNAANIPTLVDELARFSIQLLQDGQVVSEGSGRNVLRSPALSLGELASAAARRDGSKPLAAGELVSTGTLTESKPIGPGETWTAIVDGLNVPSLTLHTTFNSPPA